MPLLTLSPFGELLPSPGNQTSRGDHVGHKGWDGLRLEQLAAHLDLARVRVYPDLYPWLGRACHVRMGYYRQAEVEAVAVEDSSEALANNAHNLGGLHRVWDMLTRGACPEVLTDDEDRRPIELIAWSAEHPRNIRSVSEPAFVIINSLVYKMI